MEAGVGVNSGTPLTLLSIDDSPTVRRFIEMAMRSRPHLTVLGAGTGEDGIRLAVALQPALILLDSALPDMRGIDVLRSLKGSTATHGIPVVILSGSGGKAVEEFIGAGAGRYVLKPIDLGDLYAIVDHYAPASR